MRVGGLMGAVSDLFMEHHPSSHVDRLYRYSNHRLFDLSAGENHAADPRQPGAQGPGRDYRGQLCQRIDGAGSPELGAAQHFEPELRKALEQIGRTAKLDRYTQRDESERVVDEIIQCLLRLSRRRVGALIVFEQRTGLKDITESSGTAIDSLISAPLLENIFEPNTPLHDGAVIIRGTRIVSAACVLSLSESSAISRDLGTRHRAALGVSENTDAIVLVVSEETGVISVARGGKLTRHLDAESLRKILGEMYHEEHSRVWRWLHRARPGRKGGEENNDEQ